MALSNNRRLTRSRDDRMLFGVCGGLGEYFDVDPVIVRLVFVLAALMTAGTAIPAYIVMAIVMPETLTGTDQAGKTPETSAPAPRDEAPANPLEREALDPLGSTFGDQYLSPIDEELAAIRARRAADRNRRLAGFLLIGAGTIFLAYNLGLMAMVPLQHLWPLVLVGIGVALLLSRRRPSRLDL